MLAATDSLDRLKEELGVALGANHVIDSEAVRAQHSMGESFHKAGLPDVVRPSQCTVCGPAARVRSPPSLSA